MRIFLFIVFIFMFADAKYTLNICSFKSQKFIDECSLKVNFLLNKIDKLPEININIKNVSEYKVVKIENINTLEDVDYLKKILKPKFPDVIGYEQNDKEKELNGVSKKSSTSQTEIFTLKKDETKLKIEQNSEQNVTKSNTDKIVITTEQKINYALAIKYFNEKEYQKSYKLFEKLFNEDLQNANVNFYLGRSAFEIKNFDEAINAYDRVLILFPDNQRAKLEKARTLFALKLYDEAKEEFDAILVDKNLPENVIININKYLSLISKTQKKHFFNGVFIGTLGYDDNTNSAVNEDTIIQNINLSPTANTNKPQSDTFHQELFVLSHTYDLGKKGGDLFKQDIIIMNKIMSKYSDKNILYLSYVPKYSNSFDKYSYELGLNYDLLWYGSERLMDSIGGTVKIINLISKQSSLDGYVKISKKMNKKPTDKEKDSTSYELGTGYKYNFDKTLTSSIKYQYVYEDGKDTSFAMPLDVTKYTNSISFDLTKKIFSDYNLKYIVNLKNIDYKYVNTYGSKREDKIYNHTISLNRPITKSSLIDFKYNFTKTDSNQDTYQTNKSIYTINYIKSF